VVLSELSEAGYSYDFVDAPYLFNRDKNPARAPRTKPECRLVTIDRHFPSS